VNKTRVSSPAYGECLRLPPYVDFREPGRRLPAVRHAYTARDGIEVNEYQFAPAPPDPRAADLPPGEPSHPVGAGALARVLGWILAPFVALLIGIVGEE
jgi:hypothetical protein